MIKQHIRVRYAPSPTGFLHIGGARSALFNYLYAKHMGGDFVVRIEDTDIERNIEGAEISQIHDLEWLGIIPDESPEKPNSKYAPYRQMEKIDLYQKYAHQLVEQGHAYYCYCSEDELAQSREEQLSRGIAATKYDGRCLHLKEEDVVRFQNEGRKPTIRLKMPINQEIAFDDIVRGPVKFNSNDIGDWVIVKSNGIPTYNFAVVIDDHIMDITHVLRGEEHLSNTPKQIQVYRYFGWEHPAFGHMTIIINKDGKKLSKRDGNILQFMSQYRTLGYLPAAIFNYILLLGWTPSEEREIYTIDEAIKIFEIERLSSSPSMFDPEKLKWMNSIYIRQLSDDEYLAFIKPFLSEFFPAGSKTDAELLEIANLFKNEIKAGDEIRDLLRPILNFTPTTVIEEVALINDPQAQTVIKLFAEQLQTAPDLSNETVKVIFQTIGQQTMTKGKTLFMPVRLAITGLAHGARIADILMLIGREEALRRLHACL